MTTYSNSDFEVALSLSQKSFHSFMFMSYCIKVSQLCYNIYMYVVVKTREFQRRKSAQYHKRRAITVKVTLTLYIYICMFAGCVGLVMNRAKESKKLIKLIYFATFRVQNVLLVNTIT